MPVAAVTIVPTVHFIDPKTGDPYIYNASDVIANPGRFAHLEQVAQRGPEPAATLDDRFTFVSAPPAENDAPDESPAPARRGRRPKA